MEENGEHLPINDETPDSRQELEAISSHSVHNRQWILAEHSPNSGEADLKRIFKLQSSVISTTLRDTEIKILVKTKYLSNAPGLRVLTQHAPPQRQLVPVR